MNRKNIKFVYKYIKEYKLIWILGIIATIIATILQIRYSWLMKDLIDNALIPKNLDLLVRICILFPILVLLCSAFSFLKEYCFNYVSQKSIINMRKDLFSHILELPYRFYIKHDSGDISNRVLNDIENAQEAFSDYIVSFFTSGITVIFVLFWLFYINPKLALLMLIIIPVFVVFNKFSWKKTFALSGKANEEKSNLTNFLQQVVNSSEFIKLHGNYSLYVTKLSEICHSLYANVMKMKMIRVLAGSMWESILTPYQGVIYLVAGVWYIKTGSPSIGTIFAFINYINLLIPAALTLVDDISSMASGIASIDRIQEYLDETQERDGSIELKSIEKLEFKNVSFKYENRTVLDKITFVVNKKDFITLIGRTGSGKSTLLKLIVRLYDTYDGEILINDKNVKEYKLNSLRKAVGYMQQDPYIFKGTILENLTFLNSNTSEKQINDVLDMVQLTNLVNKLPKGLNTIVGEQGTTLSGGEKQRLSLARILLKGTDFIIMDEPSSALDINTENLLFCNLKELMADKTVLVIDHKLATVKYSKQIITLSNGRIIEQGNYNELLNNKDSNFYKLLTLNSRSEDQKK